MKVIFMAFPLIRPLGSSAMLALSLPVACKAQSPTDVSDAGNTFVTAGAAGAAGATHKTTDVRDTSSMIAPVQLPWVPHIDDPQCEHVAVEMNCADGWCRIPSGCFVAGSPEGEPGRGMRNEELTTVYLTRDFEIGQYEVTRSSWNRTGWELPREEAAIRGWDVCNDPECPMTRVSLFGAMLYANWLSVREGLNACYTLNNCQGAPEYSTSCESVTVNAASVYECEGYRLPTESEWEYAARAGARTAFFAGPMSTAVANDIGNCVQEPALDDWDWYCFNTPDNRAQPVGKKGANAWGLHDVQGNVSEFVSNPAYTQLPPAPATDPWGIVDTSLSMATRGGYFSGLTRYSRLARRSAWRIGGDAGTGFRLARTLID